VDPRIIWMLVVIAAIVVIGVVWWELRRRRSAALRARFGSEYDRVMHTTGNARAAEAALEARARRVDALHIVPLAQADAARFGQSWRIVQERFVDDPGGAVTEADRLVGEVMHARGYPLGDFEQRVEDISVDHADVVIHYRAAREIAQVHARGDASTEDLRQAMVHYRALFNELLGSSTVVETRPVREREIQRGAR
jgi:hypothetical protein